MSIEVAAILISTVVTTSEWLDLGVAKNQNHKTIEDSQNSPYVQHFRQVELDIRQKIEWLHWSVLFGKLYYPKFLL